VNRWWYVAGALFVIGTVLWLLANTRLAAANPSSRPPWFGWPPNRPRGVLWLYGFALFSTIGGMNIVPVGFGQRGDPHFYDTQWGVPFAVVVFLVGLVPYVRHNRRVRRAEGGSAPRRRSPIAASARY
jgi:hypothetical protein